VAFNVVYAAVSAPAGRLADRVPRKWVLLGGWCVYVAVYLGFALAQSVAHVVVLFAAYGVHMGLVGGAAKALVADLVPPELRATAFGTYDAVMGLLALPASLLAGLLWQGFGGWRGFGPAAPFGFGALMAGTAVLLLVLAVPTHGEN
jgi:MFS family permease